MNPWPKHPVIYEINTWVWLLFGGIVSILLGLMIWRQFPLAGIQAVGILLGIKLFFIGLIMVTAGSAMRESAKSKKKS